MKCRDDEGAVAVNDGTPAAQIRDKAREKVWHILNVPRRKQIPLTTRRGATVKGSAPHTYEAAYTDQAGRPSRDSLDGQGRQ